MTWNNLNIADKSRIIKLAVASGLTNLDTIQQVYNKKFATGGSTDPTDPPEGSNSEDLTTNYLPIVSNIPVYHNNEQLQTYRNPRIPTGIYSNDSNVTTSLSPNLSDDIQPGDWAQIDNLPTATITTKRPQQRYTEGLSSNAQIPNIDALQLYKDTQKFLNDNPSFWRNTSSFDVLNTVTGGALNWTIPSQMFGNLVNLGDAAINNGSYDEFAQGFVNGNRGIGELAESLSDAHPYWTLGLNLLGDTFAFNPIGVTKGLYRTSQLIPRAAQRTAQVTQRAAQRVIQRARGLSRRINKFFHPAIRHNKADRMIGNYFTWDVFGEDQLFYPRYLNLKTPYISAMSKKDLNKNILGKYIWVNTHDPSNVNSIKPYTLPRNTNLRLFRLPETMPDEWVTNIIPTNTEKTIIPNSVTPTFDLYDLTGNHPPLKNITETAHITPSTDNLNTRLTISRGYNSMPIVESEITANLIPYTADTTVQQARGIVQNNIDYLQKLIPGFKPYGSSTTFMEARTPHIPHDIDGYITKANFEAFKKAHPELDIIQVNEGLYKLNLGQEYGGMGIVDLNIVDVDPVTHIGNRRAVSLHNRQYPNQRTEAVVNPTTYEAAGGITDNRPYPLLDERGNPVTAEQLVQNANPLLDSMVDSMVASTGTHSKKHAGRPFLHIAKSDPSVFRQALDYMRSYLMSGGEQARVFPKLKFGTLEENKQLLKDIGFPSNLIEDVAADEARMQNALDYYYMSNGGGFGRMVGTTLKGKNGVERTITSMDDLHTVYSDWLTFGANSDAGRQVLKSQGLPDNLITGAPNSPGGSASGAGLNTVISKNTYSGRPIVGYIQPEIQGLHEGMSARDAVNTLHRSYLHPSYKLTQEEINTILNICDKYHLPLNNRNFTNGPELLRALPQQGQDVKAALLEISDQLGINGIAGKPYSSNTLYVGGSRPYNFRSHRDILGVGKADGYGTMEFPNSYEENLSNLKSLGLFKRRFDPETTPQFFREVTIPDFMFDDPAVINRYQNRYNRIQNMAHKAYKRREITDSVKRWLKITSPISLSSGAILGLGYIHGTKRDNYFTPEDLRNRSDHYLNDVLNDMLTKSGLRSSEIFMIQAELARRKTEELRRKANFHNTLETDLNR